MVGREFSIQAAITDPNKNKALMEVEFQVYATS